MRSKPENPNKGKVAAVLIVLALIWLVVGTLIIMKIKDTIVNGTYEANGGGEVIQQEEEDEDYDSGFDDQDDGVTDDQDGDGVTDGQGDSDDGVTDDDLTDDDDMDDDGDGVLNDDDDDDDLDNDSDDSDSDDSDDNMDEDDDDDAQSFTVDAWDGFAAVRTGRGTGYSEVGRLNNGEKVEVTDLENGWYKIVSGKWKGYYLHKSSLK